MLRVTSLSVLIVSSFASAVQAQQWPQDRQWEILYCGRDADGRPVPSYDPRRDNDDARNERDVVGDRDAPALYMFGNADHVFLRMRVDRTPLDGEMLRDTAWVAQFDIDFDRRNYELLVSLDATGDEPRVVLRRNTERAVQQFGDRAEVELASFPADTHSRTALAAGSSFGDDEDHFVDFAIDKAALREADLPADRNWSLVMGTSSEPARINADVACHDLRRDAARRAGASTDPVTQNGNAAPDGDNDGLSDEEEAALGTDPDAQDSDGDGVNDGDEIRADADPNDENDRPSAADRASGLKLRGGGGPAGCAIGTSPPAPSAVVTLAVAFAVLLGARRRGSGARARRR